MDIKQNRDYEYKGMCINGFLMMFWTFVVVPLMIVGCIWAGGESNLWLSVGGTAVLFVIFILFRSPTNRE